MGPRQGECLAVVLTSKIFAAASPHLYVAASVEPGDRVREWTESKNWTESTETYEAKCSGMAKN
jgi:hypothetical protein